MCCQSWVMRMAQRRERGWCQAVERGLHWLPDRGLCQVPERGLQGLHQLLGLDSYQLLETGFH